MTDKKIYGPKNRRTFILLILLFVQFILLAVANLFFVENRLDCDSAKCMTHIIKMWEHRALSIPDWSYSTTLEWDCASIFAIPFFAITGNIYVSVGLASIVLSLIFLFTVYYLLKNKPIEYFLVAANLLLIPYNFGMLDYFNMMFFSVSQYVVKVTTALLLMGLLVNFETADEKKINKWDIIALVLYGLFLFCTSMSSGIYVAATGFAATVIGYVIFKYIKWEKVNCKSLILLGASLPVIFAGLLINRSVLGGTRGDSMTLCPVYQIQANVQNNFWGMFELLGGLNKNWDLKVMSFAGVVTVLKCVFTVFLLCVAVVMAVRVIKKETSLLETLLTVSFYWNLFIMLFVKTTAGSDTSEYRYHLIGIIPLIICASIYLVSVMEKESNSQKQAFTNIVLTVLLAFLALSSYVLFFTAEDPGAELKTVAEYCKNRDEDVIYLYEGSNDSDILKVLDQTRPYICLLDTGETYAFDYYARYCLGGVQKENSIVLVKNEDFILGDDFWLLDMHFIKCDELDGWTVYSL